MDQSLSVLCRPVYLANVFSFVKLRLFAALCLRRVHSSWLDTIDNYAHEMWTNVMEEDGLELMYARKNYSLAHNCLNVDNLVDRVAWLMMRENFDHIIKEAEMDIRAFTVRYLPVSHSEKRQVGRVIFTRQGREDRSASQTTLNSGTGAWSREKDDTIRVPRPTKYGNLWRFLNADARAHWLMEAIIDHMVEHDYAYFVGKLEEYLVDYGEYIVPRQGLRFAKKRTPKHDFRVRKWINA